MKPEFHRNHRDGDKVDGNDTEERSPTSLANGLSLRTPRIQEEQETHYFNLRDNYTVKEGGWGNMDDLGHLRVDPTSYDSDLKGKIAQLAEAFQGNGYWVDDEDAIEVFQSPREHYRQRVKLGIGLLDGTTELVYLMWDENKKPVRVDKFPIASRAINDLMGPLLQVLQSSPVLYVGIRAVGFLGTMAGEMVVTLIYKKELSSLWADEAMMRVRDGLRVQVVGRSRGQVILLDRDFVTERLSLRDGRRLWYKQVEGCFSNPNGVMAQCTLDWLCSVVSCLGTSSRVNMDLLELYCGNGRTSQ